MGKLDLATVYLSGPMEYVADHGVEWRKKFIHLLAEKSLMIDCIDPTNKPGGREMKIGEDKGSQIKLQESGDWLVLRDYVHAYRRYDLRFVDYSDFLVVGIDPTIPQWGTSNEVIVAEMQHKPMFFICEGGYATLPRWLFDIVDVEDPAKGIRGNVFRSVAEVVEEIDRIDKGVIPMSNKWVLVRRYIEQTRLQRKPEWLSRKIVQKYRGLKNWASAAVKRFAAP